MGKIFISFILLVTIATPAAAITFQTLDDPLGVYGTVATGISGNDVVGFYFDAAHAEHGFLYNGSAFTTIDYPAAGLTQPQGIDGNNIVGSYQESSGVFHGFLYNGSTFTPYLIPGSSTTRLWGIEGNTLFGNYAASGAPSKSLGFVDNGSTITTIDNPLAAANAGTFVTGLSGKDVVGTFVDRTDHEHGFLFNGATYTTFDDPNASTQQMGTTVWGVSGLTAVGLYYDASGIPNGFIASNLPEPSSVALLTVGAIGLAVMARRKRRATQAR